MCKYNNQVNMSPRLFCHRNVDSFPSIRFIIRTQLSLHLAVGGYSCVLRRSGNDVGVAPGEGMSFGGTFCSLFFFLVLFRWWFLFSLLMPYFAIVHRVLGFYYLLHCYYYGLISLCSSKEKTHAIACLT